MNRVLRLSHTTIILIVFILACSTEPHAAQLKCTRVTDGDTITVATDGQKYTIRLVGIDAPEKSHGKHQPGQPFSQTSTKYLASLVLNKPVDIVSYGTDRYLALGEKNGISMLDERDSVEFQFI